MEPAFPHADLIARAAAILREEGATEVYIFGSFARGEARPGSDIDLAVTGLRKGGVISAMSKLIRELGIMSDLIQIEREPVFVRYLKSIGEMRRVA